MNWDDRHRASGDSPPVPLVVEYASKMAPGKALDLACGTGRNAVWLAEAGWDVTAVDSSPVAIERVKEKGVRVVLADLEAHEFAIAPGAWDLIVVSHYLQRDLFASIAAGLRPGGLAIVIALAGDGQFRVAPGELRAGFSSLEVLHYQESAEIVELVGRARVRPV